MAETEGIEAVLVDLDGVLYVGDEPVAGAVQALPALREAGIALRFGTNTTTRSRRATLEKLDRLGFAVGPDELFTPAVLANRLCTERGYESVALVMNEAIKEDFTELDEDPEAPDAVILGDLGSSFGFDVLNRAFRLVMGGAELIALQKNRFWRTGEDLSLDAGPFVAAIEFATGRDATVVGKPSPQFFDLVIDSFGVEADRMAMVGDDIETDIGGAIDAGMAAIQVRTGKYDEAFVAASGIEPTRTIDSVADLPPLLLDQM